MKAEDVKICCDKPMYHIKEQQTLSDTDSEAWVCFECGAMTQHTESQVDEDELQNLKDTYGEDDIEKYDNEACQALINKASELYDEADSLKKLTLHNDNLSRP